MSGPTRSRLPWYRRRCAEWHDALEAAIDRDTVLVALEPAHWTDGTRFDLDRLARRARAVGAALVVDATQVAGVMPLDVGALQPDALVVHGYKSMLANYGLGFAVFGEQFADGSPNDESWLMRRGSEDFARLVDYQDDYAPGNLRARPQAEAVSGAVGLRRADVQHSRSETHKFHRCHVGSVLCPAHRCGQTRGSPARYRRRWPRLAAAAQCGDDMGAPFTGGAVESGL